MLGEYGVLLGQNSLLSMLNRLPLAVVDFLQTREGQVAAGVLLVVLFFLFGRKR